MNFHLEFPVSPFPDKINYSDNLMFVGSCFSENIGERMKKQKFNVNINPHGILYNPIALAKALKRYIGGNLIIEEELFLANECWNSWEHHSRFSDPDKINCLNKINNSISLAHADLKKAKWLFITFGSSFFYSLSKTGIPVGNCHKVPQKEFKKELLKTDKIINEYRGIINDLKKMNPDLKIIFTVSPVRYIRDGVVENNLSKSILIQAVYELVKEYEHVIYFPAYELVMDDLRDYRFYDFDMVHPNEQAIDYVFEKFKNASFDEQSKEIFEKINELITASAHRTFNADSEAHRKFMNVYMQKCKQLQKQFPFLDLQGELNTFS